MQKTHAAEWKINGALDQGLEYDDNIGLRAQESPVFGYLLRPRFNANWSTAGAEVGITGNGDIRRYDDDRWNCDNFDLSLKEKYMQRRGMFSVSADYAQGCSYSSQIADTGILTPRGQIERYQLAPSWNWQWTPRDVLSVSPNYSHSNYTTYAGNIDGSTDVRLRNNRSYGLTLSEKHQWDHRLSSTVGLFSSRNEFSNSGASLVQKVFGFQTGAEYLLSRSWSVSGEIGGRWVETPAVGNTVSAKSNGSFRFNKIASLSLNYKDRDTSYAFGYSRSVSPSAFGQMLESSSINMNYSYQINRELSFNLDGSYGDSQAVGQSLHQLAASRAYYSASAGIVWKFARDWRLSFRYRYRRQAFPNVSDIQSANLYGGTRESNAIMLHLNYNWDGLGSSR
ncbi:MAG: hypothetical protein ACU836_02760 [Gammaproteobacteria bacterium]